ncbi:MAG: hypothetical protein JWP61_1281 [Friedmanniella sp.]|nr:hypothetical protein [Friedmanniella sp.]
MKFEGQVVGVGSSSGVRVVVGIWNRSPFGRFTNVMVQQVDGHRALLAPSEAVADWLVGTYVLDEVVVGPVRLATDGPRRQVQAPGLDLSFTVGPRTRLGRVLHLVPRRVATSPVWVTLINPVARAVLAGVQTRGAVRNGRTEFYGAYDLRRVVAAEGQWRGLPLGDLTPVEPPVTFGFASTPAQPVVTSLVTTVRGRA